MIQRFLKLTVNRPIDDCETYWRRYCQFLLAVVTSHQWLSYEVPETLLQSLYQDVTAYGIVLLTVIAFLFPMYLRAILTLVFLNVLTKLILLFPSMVNHEFLECLLLFSACLCDQTKAEDRTIALCFSRWIAVIVLFYSGLQKLLYRSYFDGAFLAVEIARGGKFADFFHFFISTEELARLQTLGGRAQDTGPYSVDNLFFVIANNMVYLGEIIFAVLLLVPGRTRIIAIFGAFGLILGIELGAREIVFGCLFTVLIFQFASEQINRLIFPVLVGVLFLGVCLARTFPQWGLN